MADLEKIRLMVSSRSLVKVFSTGEPLTQVRQKLKVYLESIRWSSSSLVVGRDDNLLDVWIHEDEAGVAADRSTLDLSIDEINRADIVVVLYTGEAGSAQDDAQIGICHAELETAVTRRPEIVFMVRLVPLRESALERDRRFRRYVDDLSLYQKEADNQDSLHRVVTEMLQNTVARLAARGSTSGGRRLDRGQALQWNRLHLSERREEMRKALEHQLQTTPLRDGTRRVGSTWTLPDGGRALVKLDAIPGAASEPAAREMVGQPFLRDHLDAPMLEDGDLAGPIHIVACHRTITESQAARMLGTPDSMVVASDFGIYAADHVQKIQLVFLAKCSDPTATGMAVRRFSEWLVQSGEGQRIAARAHSRARILRAIAAEQADDGGRAVRSKARSGSRHSAAR